MIICLSGVKGSGKDTAAECLYLKFKRLAFADELKKMVAIKYNLDIVEKDKDVYNPDLGCSIRNLLLRESMVIKDCLGEDYFVKCLKNQIKQNIDYVITDARFPKELDMLKNVGAKIIRIIRPGYESSDYADSAADGYVFDTVIINDSTKEELWAKILTNLGQ
jgi:hypothetical protein